MFNSNNSNTARHDKSGDDAPSLKCVEYERVRENFKTFVRRAGDRIRNPQGDWPALLLLERDDRINTHHLAGYDIRSAADKDYLANVIVPTLIREHEPRITGLAFHCWSVSNLADPYLDAYTEEHQTLAQHPARSECVTLLVVDDDENVEAWLASVTRRQKRPPKLGPWMRADAADGRFVTPLQLAMAGASAPAAREIPPARLEALAYYQLLFEAALAAMGQEPVENVLLLSRGDGLQTLSLEALTDLFGADAERAVLFLAEQSLGLHHFALVMSFPPRSEWEDSDLGRDLVTDEAVSLIVADDAGISIAAAGVVRDGDAPAVSKWVYCQSVPSDQKLIRFVESMRHTIG